jgi:hydroxymethylpyrimidine pyrophosphatase-like HAD family hydrolase
MDEKLTAQQKEQFDLALKEEYTGCLFDIDGTLTVFGDEYIPAFMLQLLADLSLQVPMAVCTARKLSQAYEKLATLFPHATNPLSCQAQWVMICENGAVGYRFDTDKKEYVEFHRIPYPYTEEQRGSLFEKVRKALEGKLSIAFMNEVTLVFRPLKTDDPDREALSARSHELAMTIHEILASSDPKGALKIGDSGMGVSIFPAAGDKEQGTIAFAKYLASSRGILVGPNLKELVCVGDQPLPYGNDESFLDGRFGTPFTVGEAHPEHLLPLPVFDPSSGKVLKGPEGTASLLHQLHFRKAYAKSVESRV